MAAPRVVVVGAINVDIVVAAHRLPGPGETVVGGGAQHHGGGKGANAAVAAARAGASVALIGAVGADQTGDGAVRELEDSGVDTSRIARIPGQATGVALIVVDDAGENQIAVGAGANGALDARWVETCMQDELERAGCVLVSTEIPGEAVSAAVRAAERAGVPCVLNTAPPIPAVIELLACHPLLTPNATELAELATTLGIDGGEHVPASRAARVSHAAARGARLIERTQRPIVVTLGADGALVLAPGADPLHVAPHQATVRDTTGAGDTFNGVLAVRLAAGDELEAAVRRANAAASLSVAHVGARAGMPLAAAIETAVAAV